MLLLFFLAAAPLCAQEELEGGWLRFALAGGAGEPGRAASSVLGSDRPLAPSRYGPEKALDGDPATSWVEGAAGPGAGESFVLSLSHCPEALGFHNGYAKNRSLFLKNHRLKRARVRVYAGVNVSGFATERAVLFDARPLTEERSIRLADAMSPQRVSLPFAHNRLRRRYEEFRNSRAIAEWDFPQAREMGITGGQGPPLTFRCMIRIEIAEVYRGSRWEDTCIAELWPDYGNVTGAKVSGDGRRLIVTDGQGRQMPTYADFDSALTLAEISDDGEWAVVIKEPAYLEAGERASTSYEVVHTPTGREVSGLLFDEPSRLGNELLPAGFTREGETVYLRYEDLAGGEGGRVPCRLY